MKISPTPWGETLPESIGRGVLDDRGHYADTQADLRLQAKAPVLLATLRELVESRFCTNPTRHELAWSQAKQVLSTLADIELEREKPAPKHCPYCIPHAKEWCCARSNTSFYVCSRPKGHSGNHVACNDPESHCLVVWPQTQSAPENHLLSCPYCRDIRITQNKPHVGAAWCKNCERWWWVKEPEKGEQWEVMLVQTGQPSPTAIIAGWEPFAAVYDGQDRRDWLWLRRKVHP